MVLTPCRASVLLLLSALLTIEPAAAQQPRPGQPAKSSQQRPLNAYEKIHQAYEQVLFKNPAQALAEAEKFEALAKAELGINHPIYGAGLQMIAAAMHRQGNYAEAITTFQRALPLVEKGRPADELAKLLGTFGEAYFLSGKYAEAEPIYRRGVQVSEGIHGRDPDRMWIPVGRLALAYAAQNKIDDATKLCREWLMPESYLKRAKAVQAFERSRTEAFAGEFFALESHRTKPEIKKSFIGIANAMLTALTSCSGENNVDMARVLRVLGDFHREIDTNRREARPLYRRARNIFEKTIGLGNVEAAGAAELAALTDAGTVGVREAMGEYEDLLTTYSRLVDSPRLMEPDYLARVVRNVSIRLIDIAHRDFDAAQSLIALSISIQDRAVGTEKADVAAMIAVKRKAGRFAEAEPFFKRQIAMLEKLPDAEKPAAGKASNGDPNPPRLLTTLVEFADMLSEVGRHSEAAAVLERAITIAERALGPETSVAFQIRSGLASNYVRFGRYNDAERYARANLTRWKKDATPAFSADGILIRAGRSDYELGKILLAAGRSDEAAASFRHAISLLPADRLNLNVGGRGVYLRSLAEAHRQAGRADEADKALNEAIAILEQELDRRQSLDLPKVFIWAEYNGAIAEMMRMRGRHAEALPFLEQVLAEDQRVDEKRRIALSLRRLTETSVAAGDLNGALDWSRQLMNFVTDPTAKQVGFDASTLIESTAQQRLQLLRRAGNDRIAAHTGLAADAFETSQWLTVSTAGSAIAQLGARFGAATGPAADLIREQQDIAKEYAGLERVLLNELSGSPSDQSSASRASMQSQLIVLRRRLEALNARIAAELPAYSELSNPRPLNARQARELMKPDEALVFFHVGENETSIFAVTEQDVRWNTIAISRVELEKLVSAFRRGLKTDATTDEMFDLDVAHKLYATLMSNVEDLVKDKRHLLVVPTGVLTAVPFQLLVTQAPAKAPAGDLEQYRNAAWLMRSHAITVLPSVGSLKALRGSAFRTAAVKPLIGFGDPIFGEQSEKEAAAVQRLAKRVATTRGYEDFWKGLSIDRNALSAAPRLPDTADELRAVAKTLGALSSDIMLRAGATETAVKKAALNDYRVVYFATYGLVAGDVKGVGEPSLALTIPTNPTTDDDGLLTASEVAQLKLNADWVVLSACNTIAGEKPGAEALSGLARSFFYAGARAILVSHWAVDSAATTRLTTSVFDKLKADPKIGRAGALQMAMLDFLNDPNPQNAYPAMWGAFVVVGEGAAQ